MITKSVILSIHEQGSAKRKSGIYPTEVFEQGESRGIKDTLVTNGLVSTVATRTLRLPESTIEFFTSPEGCPKGVNPKHWNSIPDAIKLRHHLSSLADGNLFNYKLV